MEEGDHIRSVQQGQEITRDTVLPTMDNLRYIPSVAEAVNDVLTSYEARAKADSLQGKAVKKSGRYNAVDTVNTPAHLCWPNEGFQGNVGKKRALYDELTMPQWVAGQLTNIHNISDLSLAKQALLQVIYAMRDATSLPWAAVRNAWASSMREVEEGTLAWGNATQWAINRLSSSQISMANAQTSAQPQQFKKICKFYNDGSCCHDGHHGWYFLQLLLSPRQVNTRQGNTHPENRCNAKSRGTVTQQNSNSC